MKGYRVIIVYGLWWLFCFLAQGAVLYWLGIHYKIAFADSLFSSVLILLCGYVTSNFFRHFRPGKSNLMLSVSWGLALAAGSVAAQYYGLLWFFDSDIEYAQFMNASIPVRFLFALLVISFMALITWLWSYMTEKREEELRRADAESLSREAELSRLRLQLQPHFLFNSLNSVNALIAVDSEQAREMIQQLSDFMRLTLKSDDRLLPFSAEIKHLQLYLGIEKTRFGHRLDVKISGDEECGDLLLPPLLMQPVAENAIKYGLYNTTGKVEITIKAERKNDMLQITTENPFDAEAPKGTGFGLNAIQRRLYLLYGRNDLLKTFTRDSIFVTQILIPQNK